MRNPRTPNLCQAEATRWRPSSIQIIIATAILIAAAVLFTMPTLAEARPGTGPNYATSNQITFNSISRSSVKATYTVPAAGTWHMRIRTVGAATWERTAMGTTNAPGVTFSITLPTASPNARYDVQVSDNSSYTGAATRSATFTNRPDSLDFTMESGNANPRGLTANATTFWAVNEGDNSKAYAYMRSNRAHDSGKTFNLSFQNDNAAGAHADDDTLWVVDRTDDKVYAHNISTTGTFGARQNDKEFELDAGNASPKGIWGNSSTIWVSDDGSERIFAYRKADGSRNLSKEFTNLGDAAKVEGIWSDGTIMFAVDEDDSHVYAYDLNGTQRWTPAELALDADHGNATGIWGNSDTLWILNDSSSSTQAVAYYIPRPTPAISGLKATYTAYGIATVVAYIAYPDGTSRSVNLRYRPTTTSTWNNVTAKSTTSGSSAFTLSGLLADHSYFVQASPTTSFTGQLVRSTSFDTRPTHLDFHLAAGNDDARGIWSDGDTIWIANDGFGNNNKVYAYDLDTQAPLADQNFVLDKANNGSPGGLHAQDNYLYVSNTVTDQIFVYTILAGTLYGQVTNRGFDMDTDDNLAGLRMPHGLWSDGNTLWAAGNVHEQIYAHLLENSNSNGDRLTAKECDLVTEYSRPAGMWSDGTTLWVADNVEAHIIRLLNLIQWLRRAPRAQRHTIVHRQPASLGHLVRRHNHVGGRPQRRQDIRLLHATDHKPRRGPSDLRPPRPGENQGQGHDQKRRLGLQVREAYLHPVRDGAHSNPDHHRRQRDI